MPRAFGGSGDHPVGQFVPGEDGGTPPGRRAVEALLEDPFQFVTELVPKVIRVGVQRDAVQRAGETMAGHFLDSGSSRWARAASTWSASRRASARAVARP